MIFSASPKINNMEQADTQIASYSKCFILLQCCTMIYAHRITWVYCVYMIESLNSILLRISSQLYVPQQGIGSLKSGLVGVFSAQKSAHAANQVVFLLMSQRDYY